MDIATLGLRIDSSGAVTAKRALDDLTSSGAKAEGQVGKLGEATNALKGKLAALAAVAGLGILGRKFLEESKAAQFAMAQLESAVASTGGAAGLTVRQLDEMATAMQKTTRFSDDAVKAAQSVLLTFTQIKGATFGQATQAVADLAERMGTDMKSAAIQVGKALNDPINGVTALTRVGVSFTEAQKDQIKAMVESGHAAQAQALILKELQTEFGGSAVAARDTLGGALDGLSNAWGDLFEVSRSSSSGIIGAINDMAAVLPTVREGFDNFFGGISLMAVDAAAGIYTAIEKIKKVFAEFVATIGAGLALFGPTRGPGVSMMQWADGVTASADMTIGALKTWKDEQYALLTAVEKTEPALKASAYATGLSGDAAKQAEKDAKALAKAQAELAKASAEAAEREMELHWAVVQTTRAFNERYGRTDPAELIQRGIGGPVATASTPRTIEQQPSIVAKLWENALRSIQESFGRTFERIFTKGLSSFRDLAGGIRDIMTGLVSQLAALFTAEKLGITKILDNISKGLDPMSGLGRGQKGALAGLAGIGIGYGIGQATGSSAAGLLGGAAGGFMAGNAILPGLGGVIGGLTGAVSGLVGAGAAQRDAARELARSIEKMREAVADFHAFATGNDGNAQVNAIRSIEKQRDELLRQLDIQLAGKKAEGERNRLMAEVRSDAGLAIQRTLRELQDSLQAFGGSLEERRLRAAGMTGAADDLAFQSKQNQEILAFQKQYNGVDGMDAVLKTLLEVQGLEREAREKALAEAKAAEEAAKAAEAAAAAAEAAAKSLEAQRAMQDLDVRILRGRGDTAAADDLAFQLTQQREFEDAQKAGRDQAYLDKLAEAQRLEREQRAQQSVEAAVDAVMAADRGSRARSGAGAIQTLTVSQGDTLLGYEAAQTDHLARIRQLMERGGGAGMALPSVGGMGQTVVLVMDGNGTRAATAAESDAALGRTTAARRMAVGTRRGTVA